MRTTFALVPELVDAMTRVPFAVAVLTKGTVLVLLAIGLTRLLTRAPAAARHLVWSLSIAGMLLLPIMAWSPWQLELPMLATARDALVGTSLAPSVDNSANVAAVPEAADNVLGSAAPPTTNAGAPNLTSLETVPPTTPLVQRLMQPSTMLVALWLTGVVWMFGRLLIGIASVRAMVKHGVPAEGGGWDELIDESRATIGGGAVAGVLISTRAAMPFTYGLFRPLIVLPASAEDWSADRCRSVLLHELAHVRRRDLLTNAIVQLACVIYWFHPLVWLAARRVRIEAERSCDALVVSTGTRASDYAGDLLEIARTMRSSATGTVALAMARRSDFEGRLLAILAPNAGRNMLTAARAAVIALTFVAPAIAVAAAVPSRTTASTIATEEAAQSAVTGDDEAQSDTGHRALATHALPESRAEPAERPSASQSPQSRDRAVPALLSVVRDENAGVRLAAIEALGQLSDPRAIDALAEALRTDADPRVREAAASALGEIDSPRAVPALISALGSERVVPVRAKIAWALGEIEDARAVDALGNALRDQAVEVRRQAIWALGEIEAPSAAPAIIPLLRDSDAETRKQAAWALGEIGNTDAVAALSAATKDADAEVRNQAVHALGEIADARALPALIAALSDDEVEVRRHAVSAIGSLELRSAPPGLIAALRDRDTEVQKAAAEALGELEDEAAVPALIPLTKATDAEVKRAAVQALADIGGAPAIEAIVALLKDEDPEIRRIAAEALGKDR
jgi:HEAT repeat protein/beta-lactamase regulating signal transducer with metallopeptidase domain